MRGVRRRKPSNGQALVEFALVFPLALLLIFGLIVIGLYVFYQQELTNIAREASRHASIHSSTAACPTASWRDPQAPGFNYPSYPYHCDGPNNPNDSYPWPKMTAHARASAWGLDASKVHLNACWSGFLRVGSPPGSLADSPPVDSPSGLPNTFMQCTIDGHDPTVDAGSLDCRGRMTTVTDDQASDKPGNQVTVYACFRWSPPLAGLLLIPSQVTMRAVITEVIQRQQ
jgi:hypothetical protein